MKTHATIPITFLVSIVAGCAPTTHIPYSPLHIPTPTPTVYSDRDWAEVLRVHVRNGRVDYEQLSVQREPLEKYLGLLSVMGPESTPDLFPTPSDRMCYYINAYNACAVRAVLQLYPTPTAYRLDSPSFERGYVFKLDRKNVTLSQIRQSLDESHEGDIRVDFCLCSAALGSPPLADQPYRADALRQQMGDQVQAALENTKLIRVDSQNSAIYFWWRLIAHKQRYLDYLARATGYRGNRLVDVLIHLSPPAQRQSLGTTRGYAEKILPFDRSLNDL